MTNEINGGRPRSIGFLLLNNFTMISLAAAVEALRMANQLSGEELYVWYTLTIDGQPVSASDGITITPDAGFDNCPGLDTVIVAGGLNVTKVYNRIHINWLQERERKGCKIGAICTGAYLLAAAGLLDGYECSTHWEYLAALQEAFPRVKCSSRLFSFDRNRMTCTGGTVPLDMMLNMIKLEHGYQLSTAISEMFICDRIRDESDQQKIPLRHVLGTTQPKLLEIVALMEANIEEVIEMDELAHYVNLSRRQMERLFQKYLDCSPSRYYLRLRLLRARQLLKQTSMSIIDIAAACGFVSSPHFSKCYREQMGIPPRDERTLAVQGDDEELFEAAAIKSAQFTRLPSEAKAFVSRDTLSEAKTESTFGSVHLKGKRDK
ncbi:GlxA family transcriptional regulator [Amphritea pacifica]|uniref:GlxA family transcriptional regulator n=1 Tax=Amphritea pacifica TaxID=2811233 RepID=A0ABS2W8E4_9GAMM|nr:GlxA family transcriptional regulator [Amphritea pacifica]MBN0987861.1 GlxA family transcriptional regulator [Amphritea pacifica]MBN1008420.1 GlxA family transcriptional regulator [Amphritea pacifica]